MSLTNKSLTNKIQKFFKTYDFQWKFKLKVCLPIIVVLIAIDWISKGAVQATMHQGETKSFIDGFLDFHYVINPGSAYGVNANNLALAVSLASVMTFLLILIFIFSNGKNWLVGISIILAGSFANLMARSWAPAVAEYPDTINAGIVGVKGGVIDFLHWDFEFFGSYEYVFNFADVWVILGVVAVLIGAVIEIILVVKNNRKEQKELQQTLQLDDQKRAEVQNEKEVKVNKFSYQDISQMDEMQKKRYLKELKAYEKMQKMELKTNEKKVRKSRK